MDRVFVPIFFIGPVLPSVEIQLVHPERNPNVFGLPQLFVRITVGHAYGLHDFAAPRIVYVVRSRDIRHVRPPQHVDYGAAGLGADAFVPELFPEAVPQVVAVVSAHVDATDRPVVLFRADRIVKPFPPDMVHYMPEVFPCLPDVFQR